LSTKHCCPREAGKGTGVSGTTATIEIQAGSGAAGRQRFHSGMLNIPTDLLRTLVAVVDLRSFTKAAHSLGITQPAVSAQIKRLQFLLGYELFDKSAPGVALTPRGESVVGNARRMLAINDQIVHLTGSRPTAQTLRIGIPGELTGRRLVPALDGFRKRWPDIRLNVLVTNSDAALRDLRQGDLDLAVVVSRPNPMAEAYPHQWIDQAVWACNPAIALDPDKPVPLLSFGEDLYCHALAIDALVQAGRTYDIAFTSRSSVILEAAAAACIGVMVMQRSLISQTILSVSENGGLPKLPDLRCAVVLREGGHREALEELARDTAAALRPQAGDVEGGNTVPLARASRSG
jgi:DNA-binding transcriptional LysR family regulator